MSRARRPARAALLLIGHGSRVGPANRILRRIARALRLRFAGRVVEACYLEAASPDVQTGIDRCVARGATRILFVPHFLFLGGHVRRDLPRAAALARRRHPGLEIRIARHLGDDRRLVPIVADRVRRGLRAGRWR
ncbi:MAG: sirohydrochlorin cobaltochelatase [Acidobacteria bacterium]|nr:MAG: sirohydrochlorin cobaltochelatase [Acidobacteriota bacterium]